MKEVITLPHMNNRPFSSAVRAEDLTHTSGHATLRDKKGNPLHSIEETAIICSYIRSVQLVYLV